MLFPSGFLLQADMALMELDDYIIIGINVGM